MKGAFEAPDGAFKAPLQRAEAVADAEIAGFGGRGGVGVGCHGADLFGERGRKIIFHAHTGEVLLKRMNRSGGAGCPRR